MSEQARRQHPAVVQDQEIIRPKKLRKVTKAPICELPIVPSEAQHAGIRTVLQRLFGDQLFGQVVIELGDEHASIMPALNPPLRHGGHGEPWT